MTRQTLSSRQNITRQRARSLKISRLSVRQSVRGNETSKIKQYNKNKATQDVISKYGIDIRPYKNSNYKINLKNGKISSIVSKSKSYVSNYERRKRGEPRRKQSTYTPVKIIFKNGKAIAKEHYSIVRVYSERESGNRKTYKYKPLPTKKEYYNKHGQITKIENYGIRRTKKHRGSDSSRNYYDTYLKESINYATGLRQTFKPKSAKKSSYLDKKTVTRKVNGVWRKIQVYKVQDGDREYTSTGKVGNLITTSNKKPISTKGLTLKEKEVRSNLIKTGQDASSLATIKAIAKNPRATLKLKQKTRNVERSSTRAKVSTNIFGNLEIQWKQIPYKQKQKFKQEVSKIGKFTYLSSRMSTSDKIKFKSDLEQIARGRNPAKNMFYFENYKTGVLQNLQKQYDSGKNTKYYNIKTKKYEQIKIIEDSNHNIIIYSKKGGKFVYDPTITKLFKPFIISKKVPVLGGSEISSPLKVLYSLNKLGGKVFSKIRSEYKFTNQNIKSQYVPTVTKQGATTLNYNPKTKKYELTKINFKTGKTTKTKITKLQYIFKKTSNTTRKVDNYIGKTIKGGVIGLITSIKGNSTKALNYYMIGLLKQNNKYNSQMLKASKLSGDLKTQTLYKNLIENNKVKINSLQTGISNETGTIKDINQKYGTGANRFIDKILKTVTLGGLDIITGLTYLSSKGMSALEVYSKGKVLDKLKINHKTKPTKKSAQRMIGYLKKYNQAVEKYTKSKKLSKKYFYSERSKTIKEIIYWGIILGLLDKAGGLTGLTRSLGVVTLKGGKQIALGREALRTVGYAAKGGLIGLETKYSLNAAKEFSNNPTSANLSLALIYSIPVMRGLVRSGKKLKTGYLPEISEVETSLKFHKILNKEVKKFYKEYNKLKPVTKKALKLKQKTLKQLKYDIDFTNKEIIRHKKIMKNPLLLNSLSVNPVEPVEEWMKKAWKKAAKGEKIKLFHVSDQHPKMFTAPTWKSVSEKKLTQKIINKAGGKIYDKKVAKAILPKNKLEKIALQVFKRKKVVIGGGRALNSQVAWTKRRATPDLDAKTLSNSKKILEQITKKANKGLKTAKYKVYPGSHSGTFKIVDLKTGKALIELTNSRLFFKIFKNNKVGNTVLTKNGLLVESLPNLIKGKANALSKINRLSRKGEKDIKDVVKLTNGRITKKDLYKLLKTQKGEIKIKSLKQLESEGLFGAGPGRVKLAKATGHDLDYLYLDTSLAKYYGKPNFAILQHYNPTSKTKTIIMMDYAVLKKYPKSVQQGWDKFFKKPFTQKQFVAQVKKNQKYLKQYGKNKVYSGFPKQNIKVAERENLITPESIYKFTQRKFFTFINGEKYQIFKVGFAAPKKISIGDIFKNTWAKQPIKELQRRFTDVNMLRTVRSVKKYAKLHPEYKPVLTKFALKIKKGIQASKVKIAKYSKIKLNNLKHLAKELNINIAKLLKTKTTHKPIKQRKQKQKQQPKKVSSKQVKASKIAGHIVKNHPLVVNYEKVLIKTGKIKVKPQKTALKKLEEEYVKDIKLARKSIKKLTGKLKKSNKKLHHKISNKISEERIKIKKLKDKFNARKLDIKLSKKLKELHLFDNKVKKEIYRIRKIKSRRALVIPPQFRRLLKTKRRTYLKSDSRILRKYRDNVRLRVDRLKLRSRSLRKPRTARKPRTVRKSRSTRKSRGTRNPRITRVSRITRNPRITRVSRMDRGFRQPKAPRVQELIIKNQQKKKKYPGYHVRLKKYGAKQPYYRITTSPLTLTGARNLGRFLTDKFIFASFSIEGTSAKAKTGFKIKTPSTKFRRPRGKTKLKGRQIYVELAKHRLDSLTETRQISAAKIKKLGTPKKMLLYYRKLLKKIKQQRLSKKKKTLNSRRRKKRQRLQTNKLKTNKRRKK